MYGKSIINGGRKVSHWMKNRKIQSKRANWKTSKKFLRIKNREVFDVLL